MQTTDPQASYRLAKDLFDDGRRHAAECTGFAAGALVSLFVVAAVGIASLIAGVSPLRLFVAFLVGTFAHCLTAYYFSAKANQRTRTLEDDMHAAAEQALQAQVDQQHRLLQETVAAIVAPECHRTVR